MEKNNLVQLRPKFDYVLLIAISILVFVGILMVYSSSYPVGIREMGDGLYFFKRHLTFVALGIFAIIVCRIIPMSVFQKYSGVLWVLSFLLCCVPFALGQFKNTYRWIRLGGFSMQPSDFLKISAALYFPKILDTEANFKYPIYKHIISLGFIMLNAGLVYAQKDLSTAIVIAAVLFVMYFSTTMKLGEIVIYAVVAPLVIYSIASKGFRSNRLAAFKDPYSIKLNGGWQILQGIYAVANGGLWGVGIGNSIQKYFYLYAAYSDYAFAILCEELGFVRAAMILLLYVFIAFRLIKHATSMLDTFSSTFLIGIAAYIGLQSMIHMAVVVNAIPSTGITLPFISYGGTSTLSFFIMVGLAFNVLKSSPRKVKSI
ncbi:MAG: putative lipid II flippase FtsW [Ezakiella sp.]|nr:putative lipid II flippase FtsW [Ezakiella sp.]MDD7472059.1 putative peptidoglycan glycosyltransferase FtsW [Bacillota bacterium]MDY3924023.1 putative peptidoglycan glycosyltransferase FtsW [Ezakiella sp.]